MLAKTRRERAVRVLCVLPHPRFPGHAVVDEDGLVLPANFTMRTRRFPTLEERIAAIESQLRESVRLYRPNVIGIVLTRGSAAVESAVRRSITTAESTGLPLRTATERDLEELFRQPDAALYDRLGQSLTSAFFPELVHRTGSWRRGDEATRRRVRPLWKAAAGAIAMLSERRPDAVLRMARGPLPPALASLIERASRTPTV